MKTFSLTFTFDRTLFYSGQVLEYSSCYNGIPETVWFINNKNLLLTVLKARKSKIKVLAEMVFCESTFWFIEGHPLAESSHERKSKGVLWNLFYKGTNYFPVNVLNSICQQIWKTQRWPQEWKRSVFIPTPKKGNAKECSKYRTIALISHASKVMLKILQAICEPWTSWCSSWF